MGTLAISIPQPTCSGEKKAMHQPIGKQEKAATIKHFLIMSDIGDNLPAC